MLVTNEERKKERREERKKERQKERRQEKRIKERKRKKERNKRTNKDMIMQEGKQVEKKERKLPYCKDPYKQKATMQAGRLKEHSK